MHSNFKINQDLILHYIEDNVVRADRLVSVYLSFSFFERHGAAYLVLDQLSKDEPSYAMIEGPEGLHDSFITQIEDPDNFKMIKDQVELFIKQWEFEN